MAGNVEEWTADIWSADYAPRRWPLVVTRGGSWSSAAPEYVQGARRNRADPFQRSPYIGFRCAR